jgi:aryl-alcohol dehydrogenase-like predicted oxidoreductase
MASLAAPQPGGPMHRLSRSGLSRSGAALLTGPVLRVDDVHARHDSVPTARPASDPHAGDRVTIPDTNLQVYPLALGGSVFGWTAGADASMRILDRYWERGGNFLDTADSYTAGRSEVVIGNWMRDRGARESTIVATKVGRNRDNPGLSPRSIIGAVQASLERLQTDYIDVLYFHFDDDTVPLEESLGAVDVLIRSGQVRHIAASDFSPHRLMEARVLAANGLPKFVALQSHYNLVHREAFEDSLAIVTKAQGMAVLSSFALAHGFLTGKYRTKADATGSERASRARQYLNRRALRILSTVQSIAAEHEAPAASIALAWLRARRGTVVPVTSASQPDQVDALMDAAGIRLNRGDLIDLDRVSAW